jgi:hypothetical protein
MDYHHPLFTSCHAHDFLSDSPEIPLNPRRGEKSHIAFRSGYYHAICACCDHEGIFVREKVVSPVG